MQRRYIMDAGEAKAIDDLSPGNQNNLLGSKMKYLFDAITSGLGTIFYLDPANGNDSNDGLSPDKAFKTLPVAYAALTANKNDVLFYIAGSSSINLSAQLVWAKSYTHFIGICSPVGVGNRARIFQTATATGISPLIDVTANGCTFKNLYIFQGVDDATSKICVRVTGQRNYFEDVHFAGIGHATMDVAGAASLALVGAAECVFKDCFIGLDTISGGANSTELSLSSNVTRVRFDGCTFYRYLGHADHALVTSAALGFDRFITFKDCLFMTDSVNQTISITTVFSLAAQTQGKIVLQRCRMLTDGASGTGDWDSNNRGLVWNDAVAPAAAAAGGVCTKQ